MTAPSRRLRILVAATATVTALCSGAAVALAAPPAPASPSALFGDTFEGGGTAGWSKSGGAWSVVSDGSKVLTQSKMSTEPSRFFAGSATWTDYAVQARVKPLSSSSAAGLVGLVARSTGPATFTRLVIVGSGRAQLQSVDGGRVSVLGTSAATYPAGGWHTLRMEAVGDAVRGLVDGVVVATGPTGRSAGRIGVLTAGGTASFDDVTVTGETGAPVPPTGPSTTGPTTPAPPVPTTTPTPPATPPTTTVSPPPGHGSPTAPWPTPAGSVKVSSTIKVVGALDGGLKRYYGLGDGGQGESQPPMFELADGASLAHVILGAPAGDGVHCRGSCTLTDVWWEDVGEDAATFLGTSAAQTMTVDGGGARGATDKVFQHNGPGTFVIRNFQVSGFGKLYRSCGNCASSYRRTVVVDNVVATAPGKAIVGINTNFGDVATLSRIVVVGDPSRRIALCDRYQGVPKGSEPTLTGSGPDGTHCRYSPSDVAYR